MAVRLFGLIEDDAGVGIRGKALSRTEVEVEMWCSPFLSSFSTSLLEKLRRGYCDDVARQPLVVASSDMREGRGEGLAERRGSSQRRCHNKNKNKNKKESRCKDQHPAPVWLSTASRTLNTLDLPSTFCRITDYVCRLPTAVNVTITDSWSCGISSASCWFPFSSIRETRKLVKFRDELRVGGVWDTGGACACRPVAKRHECWPS
ncbi:hypothetical protein LX36DRAFT_181414 [Colletotrichum falcatum]|nr:hypothetical protein LX36DRAFT_181414 [Colletotrichum falcatum]